jgi:mannose-6-phosphate isomerase-like protein (cupin superfamily)
MARTLLLFVVAMGAFAAEVRTTEPTFLRRNIAEVAAMESGSGCSYQAVFGQGAPEARIARGVTRYGVFTVRGGGSCMPVNYPTEEELYVVLDGKGSVQYGSEKSEVRKDDFLYLPPTIEHSLSNGGGGELRVLVMGFKVPPGIPASPKLQIANLSEVKKQVVGSHPDSVLYQLMMGDTRSTRDRLPSATTMVSLYVMEFKPGGTNAPHHHDSEEEIYMLLDGKGEMVAGSGMDGVEGRFPAKPGDAYFYRLNSTVGFYNGNEGVSHILAVRSTYPFRRRP